MAEIPRSLLNELTDEINALSGMAQRQAGDALTRLVADWEASGNGDIAALREAAYEVIETACGYYADTVAAGRGARRRTRPGSTPPSPSRCATPRRRTAR